MDLAARSWLESGSGARRFRRISRRQASQLPRWCDIPAAWALKSTPFFLFPTQPAIGIPVLPIRLQFQDERPTSPLSGALPRNSDGKPLCQPPPSPPIGRPPRRSSRLNPRHRPNMRRRRKPLRARLHPLTPTPRPPRPEPAAPPKAAESTSRPSWRRVAASDWRTRI
jgi:hypothetical protein